MIDQPKPSPEEQAKMKAFMDKELSKEIQMTFTKGELTVIFNVMTNVSAKYGDFLAITPIVKKIEAVVAVASSMPKEDEPIIGAEKVN